MCPCLCTEPGCAQRLLLHAQRWLQAARVLRGSCARFEVFLTPLQPALLRLALVNQPPAGPQPRPAGADPAARQAQLQPQFSRELVARTLAGEALPVLDSQQEPHTVLEVSSGSRGNATLPRR